MIKHRINFSFSVFKLESTPSHIANVIDQIFSVSSERQHVVTWSLLVRDAGIPMFESGRNENQTNAPERKKKIECGYDDKNEWETTFVSFENISI